MHVKAGFTLLECLVCLFILSVLSLMVTSVYKPVTYRDELFVLDLLSLQSDAMVNRMNCSSEVEDIEIDYNLNGNPSLCNTYMIDGQKIIVHLGWGRISVK